MMKVNVQKSMNISILFLSCWVFGSIVLSVFSVNLPTDHVHDPLSELVTVTRSTIIESRKQLVHSQSQFDSLYPQSSQLKAEQSLDSRNISSSADIFMTEEQIYLEAMILIACYAGVVAMMFYNLCLFFALKERPYLVYCLYVFVLLTIHSGFFGMSLTLVSDRYVLEAGSATSLIVKSGMLAVANLLLLWVLMDNRKIASVHHKLFLVLIAMNVLPNLLSVLPLVSKSSVFPVITGSLPWLYLITWAGVYFVLFNNIRKGDSFAPLLLISSVLINVSDLMILSVHQGWMGGWMASSTVIMVHIEEVIILIKSVTFSLLLAKNFQSLRKEKLATEINHRQSQQFFARKLLSEQEDEKKQLANALHDNFTHQLLVLKHTIDRKFGKGNEVTEGLDVILKDMRHLAHVLHPSILDKLGLSSAVETLVDKFADDYDIDIQCLITVATLDETQNILVYRIIQTYLSYVQETEVSESLIVVRPDKENIELSIKDDNTQVNWHKGSSLTWNTLQERAHMLSGKLAIDYHVDGCRIQILFPT